VTTGLQSMICGNYTCETSEKGQNVTGAEEFNHLPEVSAYEEFADSGAIKPQAKMFSELNCRERKTQRLYLSYETNGKGGEETTPGDWEYVPPEGNFTTLLRILCPKQ
jgi:hypothetical protein